MSRHTGRLVLTTADPQAAPDPDLVRGVLTRAGFIGQPFPGRPGAFAVGTELLGLLSFAGCSVVLPGSTGHQGGEGHCHVRILGPDSLPRLMWGRNTRGPRCPQCRARLADWQERLTDWLERPLAGQVCAACGAIHPPWRWDWKQQGGFGRLFVLVEEVFPGEAVPTPRLLDLLTRACGCAWRHFYVQD
ncbi:MAG: hypothetical protein ACM3ST_04440 [Bdellovibrio bacteriovorus]